MTSIDVENEFFTCRQEDDVAVIKPLKGAKNVFTKIDLKEDMMSVFESIRDSKGIKGIFIHYSDQYPGNTEHKRMLLDSIEKKEFEDPTQFSIAFIQFLEVNIDPSGRCPGRFEIRLCSKSKGIKYHTRSYPC